jgi:hypothetical protein
MAAFIYDHVPPIAKDALASSVLVCNLDGEGCNWNVQFLRDLHGVLGATS